MPPVPKGCPRSIITFPLLPKDKSIVPLGRNRVIARPRSKGGLTDVPDAIIRPCTSIIIPLFPIPSKGKEEAEMPLFPKVLSSLKK